VCVDVRVYSYRTTVSLQARPRFVSLVSSLISHLSSLISHLSSLIFLSLSSLSVEFVRHTRCRLWRGSQASCDPHRSTDAPFSGCAQNSLSGSYSRFVFVVALVMFVYCAICLSVSCFPSVCTFSYLCALRFFFFPFSLSHAYIHTHTHTLSLSLVFVCSLSHTPTETTKATAPEVEKKLEHDDALTAILAQAAASLQAEVQASFASASAAADSPQKTPSSSSEKPRRPVCRQCVHVCVCMCCSLLNNNILFI
jgi:hypothetical protein